MKIRLISTHVLALVVGLATLAPAGPLTTPGRRATRRRGLWLGVIASRGMIDMKNGILASSTGTHRDVASQPAALRPKEN
jgi:hypothetical protein